MASEARRSDEDDSMKRVRNWLSDRLYGLSCWLDRRGRDVSDLAARVRPRSSIMAHGALNEIISATLRTRSEKLVDNVVRNNALLSELAKRPKP